METTASKHTSYRPSVSLNDSLLITIFFAAVLHALFLFGISFAIPSVEKTTKQIEIILASTPSIKAPINAMHLAQDNQVGAGEEISKPAPPKQQLPSQGKTKNKPHSQKETPVDSRPKAAQKLITQKKSDQKITTTVKESPPSEKTIPKLSREALERQIAQIGAEIRYAQQNSENTRIKFVNSVSTHKYVAAQYMKDWEHKVERTGNLNYPEAARKKGSFTTLTMDVGIQADGGIYSIRISKSSGIKALDDAAKRIVRLSAPFAALPKELLEEVDVLVIRRKWKFPDKSGMVIQ